MRIAKLFVITVILGLFASCSKDKNGNEENSMPSLTGVKTYEAHTQLAKGLDDKILYATSLKMLNDSLLIVFQDQRNDSLFSVLNTENDSLIKVFGRKGNGPGEYIFPELITNLYAQDGATYFTTRTGIHSIDCKENPFAIEPTECFAYPSMLIPANRLVQFSNDSVTITKTGESQFMTYDIKTNQVTERDAYEPYAESTFDKFELNMQVFKGVYGSNNTTVAVGYSYWNEIDLFDLYTGETKRIRFENWNENFQNNNYGSGNEISHTPETIRFFSRIIPSKEHFYAIWWGVTNDEIDEKSAIPTVVVFSWNGDVLHKIKFDRPVYNFCVDSKGNIVYALCEANEIDSESHIYKVTVE